MADRILTAIGMTQKTLNDAFKVYWCAYNGKDKQHGYKDNDMSERNITFHFCKALSDLGFQIYAEVGHNTKDKTLGRIDYIAIDSEKDILLSIEAKRVHNVSGIRSIINDVSKVDHFNVQRTDNYIYNRAIKNRHGVILGITWNERIAKKWESLNSGNNNLDGSWLELQMTITSKKGEVKLVEIGGHSTELSHYDKGWLLLSHWRIP